MTAGGGRGDTPDRIGGGGRDGTPDRIGGGGRGDTPDRIAAAFGRREWLGLGGGLAVAILIRIALLPQPGIAGDDNDFLAWARAIATGGLGHAYDLPISFPPVMPWIWWLLGVVAPGPMSASPPEQAGLVLLKLPATLADFGIAAIVGWSLRARPRWAAAGALAVLLVPLSWYTSAWWGQFESLYVLPMLVAWVLLARNHPSWAAVAIAVGLMTKPQALPLVVPFAAFYLGRYGLRGSLRAGLVGVATGALLWIPFLEDGGPANYLHSLAAYSDRFAVLSLRAWNPWWILTDLVGRGQLVADNVPIVGPLTIRWLGLALAGVLELAVFLWVWRRPTLSTLAWGAAAAALAAFIGLTTMHERYAYPAVVFLILAWPNRWAVGTWLLVAITASANVIAAAPPQGPPGSLLSVAGPIGIVGSLAMTVALVGTVVGLRRASLSDA